MPIIKAAIKALRQSKKRRALNRAANTKLKLAIKEFKKLVAEKKLEDARGKLPHVTSLIDKGVKRHNLHRNNAARKKSHLQRSLGKC